MALAAFHTIETATLTQALTYATWFLAGNLDPSVKVPVIDKATGFSDLEDLLWVFEELTGTRHPVDAMLADIREEVDTHACTAS
jgi:hypothetical protein